MHSLSISNKLTACEKYNRHMNAMRETAYARLPLTSPDARSLVKLFERTATARTFLNDSDERDVAVQGTVKPIHTLGVSAGVEYVPTEDAKTKYTGVFETGGIGILRLSRATNSEPFTPGMALKLFIDNEPSVNVHAMYSLDGQSNDYNFFRHEFTTHVKPPVKPLLKVLAFFFRRALPSVSQDPNERPVDETFLPLLETAMVRRDGTFEVSPKGPKELHFVSEHEIDATDERDFRENIIKTVRNDSILYDVKDENDDKIGHVRVIEGFIASEHGDAMHFKHQRISGTPDGRVCPLGYR